MEKKNYMKNKRDEKKAFPCLRKKKLSLKLPTQIRVKW